jgi:hypothetical protein
MKNYKLFAFTDEEKEAISKKARNLGISHGGLLPPDDEFVYIYIEERAIWAGNCYEYFKYHQNKYISVHDFLALSEPKKEFPLKAGDMVIAKDSPHDRWNFEFFSHLLIDNEPFPFRVVGSCWGMIAPFEGNEDKPGTRKDAVGVWTAEDIEELYGSEA